MGKGPSVGLSVGLSDHLPPVAAVPIGPHRTLPVGLSCTDAARLPLAEGPQAAQLPFRQEGRVAREAGTRRPGEAGGRVPEGQRACQRRRGPGETELAG